jgi:hypothetical protein
MIRFPVWISASVIVAVGGIDLWPASDSQGGEPTGEKNVAEIKGLILELPEWPFVPVFEDKEKQAAAAHAAEKIEGIVGEVSKQRVERIRAAVHEIESTSKDSRDLERLFILNQYLFAIPDRVVGGSSHRRYLLAGYTAMPESVMKTNSWPWEIDDAGNLRFGTAAHGIRRMGPPYPATEVFDYVLKEFGLREKPERTK